MRTRRRPLRRCVPDRRRRVDQALNRRARRRAIDCQRFQAAPRRQPVHVSLDPHADVDCPRYLFSTNGADTRHPHPEASARVLVADMGERTLLFNYTTRFNNVWNNEELRRDNNYEVRYPDPGVTGLTVEL